MWDKRYSSDEYAYGIEPNSFLKANFNTIPKGKVLSLAEGEGRNAVFLARQGYSVTAVDSSLVGIGKGRKLASYHGVDVEFIHADLITYDGGLNQWDGIVSIFFPLSSLHRQTLHKKVVDGLKKSGVLLLEAYTPEQLKFGTGGGKNAAFMQSKVSLIDEFRGLKFGHLVELERSVVEGSCHTGMASVVQAIATK
jgi:SAM-dependent methyltransferase